MENTIHLKEKFGKDTLKKLRKISLHRLERSGDNNTDLFGSKIMTELLDSSEMISERVFNYICREGLSSSKAVLNGDITRGLEKILTREEAYVLQNAIYKCSNGDPFEKNLEYINLSKFLTIEELNYLRKAVCWEVRTTLEEEWFIECEIDDGIILENLIKSENVLLRDFTDICCLADVAIDITLHEDEDEDEELKFWTKNDAQNLSGKLSLIIEKYNLKIEDLSWRDE